MNSKCNTEEKASEVVKMKFWQETTGIQEITLSS